MDICGGGPVWRSVLSVGWLGREGWDEEQRLSVFARVSNEGGAEKVMVRGVKRSVRVLVAGCRPFSAEQEA